MSLLKKAYFEPTLTDLIQAVWICLVDPEAGQGCFRAVLVAPSSLADRILGSWAEKQPTVIAKR